MSSEPIKGGVYEPLDPIIQQLADKLMPARYVSALDRLMLDSALFSSFPGRIGPTKIKLPTRTDVLQITRDIARGL